MNDRPTDETIRRLLVAKQILGTPGSLTPHSDPIAVAQSILAAHDAAELAAATIASVVGAQIGDKTTLMEYPAAIVKRVADPAVFPGRGYLDALNRARRDFKHAGMLPSPADWYRVTEKVATHISDWCRIYLGLDFEELSAYELLADERVRNFYRAAYDAHREGRYQEALEQLARALVLALHRVPRLFFSVVGEANTHQALLLTAFGVSPSEFLTLQEFLPNARSQFLPLNDEEFVISWDTREHGHPANWTRSKVAFCLSAFLNVALKIQHAPQMPLPMPFYAVYDDLVVAREEPVELWHYVHEGSRTILSLPTGRRTVFRLEPGSSLRCTLSISPYEIDIGPRARRRKPVESANVLEVRSETLPDGVAYVERAKVEISFKVKENDPLARHVLAED